MNKQYGDMHAKNKQFLLFPCRYFFMGKCTNKGKTVKIKGKKPNAKLLLDGYGVEINGHPTAIPLLSLGTKMGLQQIRILILMTFTQG